MSKASDRWASESKYTLLGLEPPSDKSILQKFNNDYIRDFLIPASYMVSGKSKEEFDFDKANKLDSAAIHYLSTVAAAAEINQFISILYHKYETPIWMMFLPDLVDLYEYDGLLKSSIDKAISKYMETHSVRLGTYGTTATDIEVVIDSDGNPINGYPQCYLYSDSEVAKYQIKHGTNTLLDVCEKDWWKYDTDDEALLAHIPFDFSVFVRPHTLPVLDPETNTAGYKVFRYDSPDRPPKEVVSLMMMLPDALINDCGDPLHALLTYVQDNPKSLSTDDAKAYVKNLQNNKEFVNAAKHVANANDNVTDASTVPSSVRLPKDKGGVDISDRPDFRERLESEGFVVQDLDTVILDYIKSANLSGEITVNDLIKYMNDTEDTFLPVPFDKEAYKEEVLKSVDWDGVKKEAIDSVDWDGVKRDAIASIDKAAVVKECLQSVGVDQDTIARINIAMTTSTKADIKTTNYVDRFEEAGSIMLHRVREALSADPSFENRQRVQDVMYAYFVVLMAEEKKLDDVIQFTIQKRDSAQGDAKKIIDEALEVMRK